MSDRALTPRIEQLKAIKSAYLLEARKSKERGLDTTARALYLKAGEMELDLAELIRAAGEPDNETINLLSAGSCLMLARQYRRAYETLDLLREEFPNDVPAMLAECEGKDDVPLPSDSQELRALIGLLLRKEVINPEDWAEAIAERG